MIIIGDILCLALMVYFACHLSGLYLEKGIDEPTESGWYLCWVNDYYWDVVYFCVREGWDYDYEINKFYYLPNEKY